MQGNQSLVNYSLSTLTNFKIHKIQSHVIYFLLANVSKKERKRHDQT